MKILFSWLKDYIDLDRGAQEAAAMLTMLGFESFCESSPRGEVLDVEITSNRPDCLSVRGIARELGAAWELALNEPDYPLNESGPDSGSSVNIKIQSPLCPRYAARVIRGVKVQPSPDWVIERIEASGMRPVNNVVDCTNYALLATGHPLHAFDLSQISGAGIVVRQALPGEEIVTIDGVKRNLDDSMLIIADSEKPAAVAGIMGGARTEVGAGSVDILLEGAYFDPANIRRTAKKLAMDTEASYRFQRGADIEEVIASIDYAAHLITLVSGGAAAPGVVDVYKDKIKPVTLTLRPERVKNVLGVEIGEDFISRKLALLGFEALKGECLTFSVPSYRRDVSREIDLIEEIARLYGYDNIPETVFSGKIPEFDVSEGLRFQETLRKILVSAGLYEAVNIALISRGCAGADEAVNLLNPLSEEQAVLRPSLLPGLMLNVQTNIRRGARDIRLFELGSVFKNKVEKLSLAGVLAGVPAAHWMEKTGPLGYFHVKGIVERLLEEIKSPAVEFSRVKIDFLDAAESAAAGPEGKLGVLGKVSEAVAERFAVESPVYYFELDFDLLLSCQNSDREFIPPAKYPACFRDAAFVLPEDVSSQELERIIRKAGGELLEGVELFDLYRGAQVPPGHKSMAFSLSYRAPDRTLQDSEASETHDRIVKAVETGFNAKLRED